jgi:hypothetical protein
MKQPTHIQNLAAGVSLFVLAVGFSLLGYLSLIIKFNNSLAAPCSVEPGVCLAASISSLGVGLVFLVAALLYWRWYIKDHVAYSIEDHVASTFAPLLDAGCENRERISVGY